MSIIIGLLTIIGAATCVVLAIVIIEYLINKVEQLQKRRCINCGAIYKWNDKYCSRCGKKINGENYESNTND